MTVIPIHTSHPYDVVIGSGILPQLGRYAAEIGKPGTAAVVSDSTVWPLYGETVENSLRSAGFRVVHFVFPAGEASKCGKTYLELLDFLAESRLTRTDLIVALGGGVTGDLSGFAAATYLRGIQYIQVPTTLLAAVDSSVGGKTAIDLPSGKNLAGAFHQPCLVLCDIDTLNTLPADIFRDGCAEVLKYAVLFDSITLDSLNRQGLCFPREEIIARCVAWKRDVVQQDEKDRGMRQLLNLGHTLGHSVEHNSAFTLSHGQSVAIGMAIMARSAAACGLCTADTRDRILAVLHTFGLPTETDNTVEMLMAPALSDKKRAGGTVNLIIPYAIGDCRICPTPVEALPAFIQAGLSQ